MRISARSTLSEVALAAGATLIRHGIDAVLTGGACAAVHSGGACVSTDVDFVIRGRPRLDTLDRAMAELGFTRQSARYVHPLVPFSVEFPAGPLGIGSDLDIAPVTLPGPVLALSPTDSCRDRLAAFYHWNDRQSLAAAVAIALRVRVNLGAIRRWSRDEGQQEKLEEFLKELETGRSRVAGAGAGRRKPRKR
jgi:hypothetical protein